jgi:hypothetical protein
MPTLAILLVAYYVAGILYQVVRGPHYETYTPLKAMVLTALTIAVSLAWFSLPFCGGLPAVIWVLLIIGWCVAILALGGIGQRVYVDAGPILLATFFGIVYITVLLTSSYC